MRLVERLDSSRAYRHRTWKDAVAGVKLAKKDIGDLLNMEVPGYPHVWLASYGSDITIADGRATAMLLEDQRNDELREKVAAFNNFVTAVMERAGISQLSKKPSDGSLRADVYVESSKGHNHHFEFRWEGMCKTKKYRVTTVNTIEMCGELSAADRGRYASVVEITE